MPVRRIAQFRVLTRRKGAGIARPGQWLPRRETRYWHELGGMLLLVQLQPYRGLYALSLHRARGQNPVLVSQLPDLWVYPMKKFVVGGEGGSPLPPLSAESKLFSKLPRFRQFLTETAYEDGSPRAPGRFWFDQDGVGFTITLMEPTAFARVRLRATTIDDVFMLAEVHLGAENPPWEVDNYARERAAGKKKK